MLTFLRHIRKSLIESGSTKKYLLYALGEIALVVIGILIALQINNWNSSFKSKRQIEISITHIKEEISNNIEELNLARKINQPITEAFSEYRKIQDKESGEPITSPEHMDSLQSRYPGFFRISDTLILKPNVYQYSGTTFINLELAELTEIAWETTRSVRITNEFEYECLYNLESMYSLQRRVKNEIDKAANALQISDIKTLLQILEFLKQLDNQLELDYKNMLASIDFCR